MIFIEHATLLSPPCHSERSEESLPVIGDRRWKLGDRSLGRGEMAQRMLNREIVGETHASPD